MIFYLCGESASFSLTEKLKVRMNLKFSEENIWELVFSELATKMDTLWMKTKQKNLIKDFLIKRN